MHPLYFMKKEEKLNRKKSIIKTITFMTDTQTDGHGDSMTDPAQRAKSVKIGYPERGWYYIY